MPSSTVPSTPPSLSGWVASISATSTTQSEISTNEINNYASEVAEYYGVDPSEVTATAIYSTSGSMQLSIPSDIQQLELEEAITASIAEVLGVHSSDILVEVDMDTGGVTYLVASNDFETIADSQFALAAETTQNAIIDEIEDVISSVVVESVDVANEIEATIEIVVDADNARNDLTQAAWRSEELLSDFGNVIVQSN